jgi:hypothetical protein
LGQFRYLDQSGQRHWLGQHSGALPRQTSVTRESPECARHESSVYCDWQSRTVRSHFTLIFNTRRWPRAVHSPLSPSDLNNLQLADTPFRLGHNLPQNLAHHLYTHPPSSQSRHHTVTQLPHPPLHQFSRLAPLVSTAYPYSQYQAPSNPGYSIVGRRGPWSSSQATPFQTRYYF